jgi:ABC-type transporter Mla subunit MlaD
MPATRAVAARSALLLLVAACGGSPPPAAPAAPPARAEPVVRPPPARPDQPERALLWAWLADAGGLAVGARVTVAGLPVGEIAAIRPGPHGTRVDISLPAELAVWSNARLSKRPSQVLGELRLELDPGEEPGDGERASRFAPRRLADGDEIADVVESPSLDALIEGIDEQLPGR